MNRCLFVCVITFFPYSMLMPCGPATAELDTRFNAAGIFSGISGTAEIRFPSGAQLLDLEFKGVATDDEDNIYLGGFLSNPGNQRFLAYKLTPTGVPIWFTALSQFSSSLQDQAHGIAIDASGCSYLGGWVNFAGETRFAASKLSPTGTFVWMSALPLFSGSLDDRAQGIAVDDAGCVYLGGFINPPGVNNNRFAAAKLTNSGTVVWMTALPQFAGLGDEANAIAVDASGCVYLGGFTNPAGPFNNRFAAAKLDNSGVLVWMTALPAFTGGSDEANGIALDPSGAIYLGGHVEPTFNTDRFAAAKLTNAGELIWMNLLPSLSGSSDDTGNGIAIDDDGCIYLAGSSRDTDVQFAAVKLTPDGEQVWSFIVPSFGVEFANIAFGVSVDTQQAVVLGGQTEDSSRGAVAKLLQQAILPPFPPSPLLALSFIPMAAV